MADARKRAEEWLDEYGGEEYLSTSGLLHARETAVDLLRAILAEEPPVGQLVEGEPGHESCVGCGRPVSAEEPGAAKAEPCRVCERPVDQHRHGSPCSCQFCCNRAIPLEGPTEAGPVCPVDGDLCSRCGSDDGYVNPPINCGTFADVRPALPPEVREAAVRHHTTLLAGLAYIARESWWPDDASVTDGVRNHVAKMRDAADALSALDAKGGAA